MLLAVDTSTAQVGLALFDGSRVPGEMIWTTRQHHTTELAPALSELLTRCGISIEQVSALGVAIGPGSFTSLRVGLSLVKGLALARSLPVLGIPTLDIIAAEQPLVKKPLIAVLQAGRGRLAHGRYRSAKHGWQAEGPVQSGSLDDLIKQIEGPTLIAGELSTEQRQGLKRKNIILASPARCIRRPAVLAELAWSRMLENDLDDAATLAPIYLHVAGAPPA